LSAIPLELGYIRESDLKLALLIQKERPTQKIAAILVERHALSEERLVEILAIQLGIDRLDPRTAVIESQLLQLIQDPKWLRTNELIPIERRGTAVVVAFADPMNKKHVDGSQKIFGRAIIIGIAGKHEIFEALDRNTAQKPKGFPIVENMIVDTVDKMLRDAVATNTSDIHIEPQKGTINIRFRQDGVLVKYQTLPAK
jgi:type IV pilus assembly protein PilB